MTRTTIGLAFAVSLAAAASAHGQGKGASVRWIPTEPVQGSFVQLVVAVPGAEAGSSRAHVAGNLAGQPLHFDRMADGTFHAVGAIPISAKETIPLTLEVRHGNGTTEEPFTRIPVTPAEFASEQLQVAPRYTAAPDSALRVRIAAERERSRQVIRRTHGTPRLWSGAWLMPVHGRVTSPYGKQREFNGEVQSRHYGVDLDGDTGTPVHAPNRAVVALTDDTYYGGKLVYLDHGRGLVTGYLHLSEILVAQGDTVSQGQIIGEVGATGRVTGPHLHWLARYGPITVDALSLFALQLDMFGLPPIRSSGDR